MNFKLKMPHVPLRSREICAKGLGMAAPLC